METPEKDYFNWKDVEDCVETIASWAEKQNFKYITGPARGGLIPAVLLSHLLDIKFVTLGTAKTRPEITRARTLLIDDICDSGKTFKELEDWGFATASLVWRHNSEFIPDCHAYLVEDDSWIVFPWERKDSETIQDYLK